MIKPKLEYDSTFSIAYDILKKHYELEEKLASNGLNIGASCNCDNTNMLNALMDIKSVLENKECGCKETIIEKPVEKIVYKEKVVEKPVVKEKVVEKVKVIIKQNTVYKYIKDGKVVKSENKTTYITTPNNSFGTCSNDRYIVNKTVISKSEMDANKQRHINNVNRLKAAKAKQAA